MPAAYRLSIGARCVDIAFSLAGLLVCAPVLLVCAIAILVDDGFPVLFSQVRVGRKGVPFRVWKLRTMRAAAGPQITSSGDRRILRTGVFLRKFKLDELPQLGNTLCGHMSLVGPRPEVPRYVQLDEPVWRRILEVRPGITDLATLIFRNEEEILRRAADPEQYYRDVVLPAKLQINQEYLQCASFSSDLRLIFLTVKSSILPRPVDALQIFNFVVGEPDGQSCIHSLSYTEHR